MATDTRWNRSEFSIRTLLAVVAMVAVVGGAAWWVFKTQGNLGSFTAEQPAAVPPAAEPSSRPSSKSSSASPAGSSGPAEAATPGPRERARSSAARANSRGADAPVSPVPPAGPDKKLETPAVPPPQVSAANGRPAASSTTRAEAAPAAAIFDATDAGVTPPKLLTPPSLVPLPPGTDREGIAGSIQLVVNEDGSVDSVKTTVVPKTIAENILVTNALSIAKSWRFEPARRNGRPVKARLLVPLSMF